MSIVTDLVSGQLKWLDTTKLRSKQRYKIIQPLIVALDHIKECNLPQSDALPALAGKLLKIWEGFDAPIAACSEEEAPLHIAVYVQRVYNHFLKEWGESRANLTHQRESLENAVWFELLKIKK